MNQPDTTPQKPTRRERIQNAVRRESGLTETQERRLEARVAKAREREARQKAKETK